MGWASISRLGQDKRCVCWKICVGNKWRFRTEFFCLLSVQYPKYGYFCTGQIIWKRRSWNQSLSYCNFLGDCFFCLLAIWKNWRIAPHFVICFHTAYHTALSYGQRRGADYYIKLFYGSCDNSYNLWYLLCLNQCTKLSKECNNPADFAMGWLEPGVDDADFAVVFVSSQTRERRSFVDGSLWNSHICWEHHIIHALQWKYREYDHSQCGQSKRRRTSDSWFYHASPPPYIRQVF